jgi:hypothetical protein
MALRAPQPDINAFSGPQYSGWRHWLAWAARKLGGLPEALTATMAWNPGSVAAGSFDAVNVLVSGAQMGDPVSVGFTDEEPGIFYVGTVRRAGVVTVTIGNLTATPFNMNAGTLTVIVWRVG